MNATIVAALIAFLGALVASLVSYIGLLISKESKISEFRQAWIDALRNDIAEQIARLEMYPHHSARMTPSELHRSEFSIATARCRILLRMNLEEIESKGVTEALENFNSAAIHALSSRDLSMEEHKEHMERHLPAFLLAKKSVVEKSQALLKMEWDRVKLGEPVYWKTQRYVKRLAIASGCSAAIMIMIGFTLWCYRLLIPPAISVLSR
jgi:hypothetical protein